MYMVKKKLNILLLEDNKDDVGLVYRELTKADLQFDLKVVEDEFDYRKELNNFKPDIILSDHSLPSFNSMEALSIIQEKNIDVPFILVTGTVSEEFAVECMKAGADDYILKSSLVRLPPAIESILASREIKREKEIIESLHKKLQSAYAEIAEKNKSITDSINYAKRIQEAMLPKIDVLTKKYPGAFILYRPKDIVSGDFYWFLEYDGKFLIAVADCTGHGVSGALMSMIGHNLLNQIVKTKNTTKPEEILKRLNMSIRKVLKQDTDINPSWDGMDIAICSIDQVNKIIEFAGANRPLYYSRNKKIEIIKGDKNGTGGGMQVDAVRVYTNHKFSYQKNDVIYMFTDGYSDQFGGKYGKKMTTKKLLYLLQAIQSNTIQNQKMLVNLWFDEWKGELEQTDDSLMIGIKL